MIKKFILPLFEIEFAFYIGEKERKKFLKIASKKDTPEREEFMHSEAEGITNGTYMFIKDINCLGSVVHELHHVAHNITDFLGIHDEETEAYVQQYMMGQYLHIWQDQK